jgi:4-hydroxybenzoate polyprenyltransferase
LWIPLIGYGFAHWDRALDWTNPRAFLVLLGAWLLLNAGTMWLNQALDPEQSAGLFTLPTPLPRHLDGCGYAALVLATATAAIADLWVGVCAAACAVLAVLYSHPATAWKGHPVAGPAVNVVGYGVLSTTAGWLLVGVSLNLRTAAVIGLLTLWLLGATFCAQAFQLDHDRRRDHRTLVATHGPRVCLQTARFCMDGAVGAVLVLTLLGWFPRLCLVATPAFWWADRWLSQWQQQPRGGGPAWAAGLVHRMMLGGSLMFAAAYADYLLDCATGNPVAGLATASARP